LDVDFVTLDERGSDQIGGLSVIGGLEASKSA